MPSRIPPGAASPSRSAQFSVQAPMALEREGGAEQQQCGRIVQQALALEHVDRAARHADAAQDGRRGSRIGRRDDRAERERCIEREPGERDAEPRDRAGAQQDRHDGKREQRPPQSPDRADGEVECRVDQHRGDEQREGNVRIEVYSAAPRERAPAPRRPRPAWSGRGSQDDAKPAAAGSRSRAGRAGFRRMSPDYPTRVSKVLNFGVHASLAARRALLFEAVVAVPLQEVGMRPIRGSSWFHRPAALVYQGTNAVRIVDLPRHEDFKVIGEAD